MTGRRNTLIAREGIPFFLASVALTAGAWHFAGWVWAVPPALVCAWLFLIFRDPKRVIPAVPLGVVSPVDGVVAEVGLSDTGIVGDEVNRIVIRVSSLGTYTARSAVEGKIMDLDADLPKHRNLLGSHGLWVRTDEDEDVVLQFRGHRFGLAPRAFLGFGERVGQGQRCAWLRLTRQAELQLPLSSRVLVKVGQRVSAGTDVLAKLPHH